MEALKNWKFSALIVISLIKVGLLEWQLQLITAHQYDFVLQINGLIVGLMLVTYILHYAFLPKVNRTMTRQEILRIDSKYDVLNRKAVYYLLTFVGTTALLFMIRNIYFQQLAIAAFFVANVGVYINCFNNKYQFRVLYGLELYSILLVSTALYAALFLGYFTLPYYLLPLLIYVFTFWAFEYLLTKRKHRIYTTHCVNCHFRRNRRKHLLIYSLIYTGCFLFLLFAQTNVLLAGLTLTMTLHTLRSFTCNNFKHLLTKETKECYIFIVAILLLIVVSTMSFDRAGRNDVADPDNNSIVREAQAHDTN